MKNKRFFYLIFSFIIIFTQVVSADDWYGEKGKYYKVYNVQNNKILFETAREVNKGDQYLSSDNKMYEVIKINKQSFIAYAKFIKDIDLPEIDEEAFARVKIALEQGDDLSSLYAAAQQPNQGKRKVGIYATHSSESYVPSDGSESIEGNGGIFKVAQKVKEGFEKNGVQAIFDNTPHDPHDAGAYKRSRRTALQLLRSQNPNALIDIHRDAVPAEAYVTEIKGEPASKVRLVVGRRNQNFKANEEMAIKVKAVADKMYPGLVKDIFYAKGDYNQDLTPRAMLLEMGTYQHTRQRAEKSAAYISEVITTALFGGTFRNERTGEQARIKSTQSQQASNKGSGAGILGALAVIGGGGLAFLFFSSGGKEWKSKISNFKQEFYNFLGRSRKKK